MFAKNRKYILWAKVASQTCSDVMSSSKGLLDRLKDLVRHPSEVSSLRSWQISDVLACPFGAGIYCRTLIHCLQEDRSFWLDDIKCKACYECDTPFHLLLRRHHCR